jgi:hypothetical protein
MRIGARHAATIVALLFLTGCASSVAYRADYVPSIEVIETERIDGRVLVYTTRDADEKLYTGGASSFTGSGAKLTVPIGLMTREIAVKVFSAVAQESASASPDLKDSGRYAVIVRPETTDFKYGFPQLQNLGFAITPNVEMTLRIQMLDVTGAVLLEKSYQSGVREGKSYMMSGSPYERINRLAHETLTELMRKAANDVRTFQLTKSPAGAARPGG